MSSPSRLGGADFTRFAVIALVLAEGGIHLQQYEGVLRQVPTINTLFLLNAISAAVIALALTVVRDRPAILLAFGAAGMSIVALVSLAIARTGTLFAYSEPALRPAVTLAAASELGAVLAAAAFVLLRARDLRAAPATA